MNDIAKRQSLDSALFSIQCRITGVERDGEGNYGNYTTLSKAWETLRPLLEEYGVLVNVIPGKLEEGGLLPVTLRLSHVESGGIAEYTMGMPLTKIDPQGFGSALTYSSRYVLMTFFGMAPHDDDGQAASGMTPDELANFEEGMKACDSLSDLKALFSQAYRSAGSDAGAVQALGKIKNARKAQLECDEASERHRDSLIVVTDGIREGDLSAAAEAYLEIPKPDQILLKLAASKGGYFSTEEQRVMKSNEWYAATRSVGPDSE